MASKPNLPRRFRLAVKPLLYFAALAQSPPLVAYLAFLDSRTVRSVLLIAVLQAPLTFVMLLFLCTVGVNTEGLSLNRVNFLRWDQVERVTPSTWLGLRYLKARRRNRLWAWWFPLYLADEDGFRRAVIELAPDGNPFRTFFEMEVRPRV